MTDELQRREARIQPALLHQFGVSALRDDGSVIEYNDSVGVLHG